MTRSPLTPALFALALLVRGMAVPGYMAGGEGWPVQLCPQGLSGPTVALLFGPSDQHHAHHHAHHSPAGTGLDPTGSAAEPADRAHESDSAGLERCALGGSSAPALPPASLAPIPAPAELLQALAAILPGAVDSTVAPFRARAPPLRLL